MCFDSPEDTADSIYRRSSRNIWIFKTKMMRAEQVWRHPVCWPREEVRTCWAPPTCRVCDSVLDEVSMCRLFIDYVRLPLLRRSFLRIQFLWKLDPQTNQRGVSKDKLHAQQFSANLVLFVSFFSAVWHWERCVSRPASLPTWRLSLRLNIYLLLLWCRMWRLL